MFKSNHTFIGSLEKGSLNNTAKWDFAEGFTKDNVEAVQTTCGCSAAILLDSGVIASFNEQDVVQWEPNSIEQNRKFYPEGFITTKQIEVYLKDGKEKDFKREDGGTYPNPAKERIILTFSAFVKF